MRQAGIVGLGRADVVGENPVPTRRRRGVELNVK
jgi:hypothetical protein